MSNKQPTPPQPQPIRLRFDLAQMRKNVKLMVGTPMYGGQCSGVFAQCMGNLKMLFTSKGIEVKEYYLMNE